MLNIIFAVLILASFSAKAELSDKIPYPFHAVQDASQNKIRMIDDGIEALRLRIEMIRQAKKTIEVEYFIYNIDTAGRILTKELIAAAHRGIRVRVLIDKSQTIFVFKEPYAKVMHDLGIEVRYYNGAPLLTVSTAMFRDHRKLIVVDDREAITGGRNLADEYFDLSDTFNFTDTDILVKGPMAKVMRESFDLYFENHITERPKLPKRVSSDVKAFFTESTGRELETLKRLKQSDSEGPRRQFHTCPVMTFSTDAPGADLGERLKSGFVDRYRFLRKTIFDKASKVDRELIVSSPYMVDSPAADRLMDLILSHGVKINLYTNSLGSTDAIYIASQMYLGLKRWRAKGVEVTLHDSKWVANNQDTPEFARKARSGIHAKIQVYLSSKSSEVMIGTYNVDHRSAYYNTELGVFCRGSDAFTDEVISAIRTDEAVGLKVSADAKSTIDRDGKVQSIYASDAARIRKMKRLTPLYWLIRPLL